MRKYDINLLTKEEKEKMERIVKMMKIGMPEFIKETSNLDEQILFIRKHGQNKMAFYSEEWYRENTKRTKAIYFKVRETYVKNYRITEKKFNNAKKSLQNLITKSIVPEETTEKTPING